MMAAFRAIHSVRVHEDAVSMWIEMSDGSVRALHWEIDDLIAWSAEVHPADESPNTRTVQ